MNGCGKCFWAPCAWLLSSAMPRACARASTRWDVGFRRPWRHTLTMPGCRDLRAAATMALRMLSAGARHPRVADSWTRLRPCLWTRRGAGALRRARTRATCLCGILRCAALRRARGSARPLRGGRQRIAVWTLLCASRRKRMPHLWFGVCGLRAVPFTRWRRAPHTPLRLRQSPWPALQRSLRSLLLPLLRRRGRPRASPQPRKRPHRRPRTGGHLTARCPRRWKVLELGAMRLALPR